MKKLFTLVAVLVALLAGHALATGTRTVTLNATGFLRTNGAGGYAVACQYSPGSSQYWATLTTATSTHLFTLRDRKTVATWSTYGAAVTGARSHVAIASGIGGLYAPTYYSGGTTVTTYDASMITIDLSSWVMDDGTVGGFAPGVHDLYYTEVTAASDAFITCTYVDPD